MEPKTKIFNAYFELKQSKLYYNQIKEHTNLSHSSLQNQLIKLVSEKILKEEKTKGNKFYKILDKKKFTLKFCELAINKFRNLNTNVKVPLKYFLKNISPEIFTIILFGSSANKQENKNSDIDILIVSQGNVNIENNKKQAEITSKHHLSIFNCTIKQFKDNEDHLVIQAKKTGFPIYKEQNFYEEIINEHQQNI
ncbi:MAG: nucleotidyltransferase domain-containing protein [Candidatus Woesearchaeota archaeon]